MPSVILPPNVAMNDQRGRPTPEWYRFFVAIQKDMSNAMISIDDAELLGAGGMAAAFSDASAFADQLFSAPIWPDTAPDNLTPPAIEPDPTYPGATETVATDADFSVSPNPASKTVLHTGVLTAGRTVTLVTAGAQAGTRTIFTRVGAGAFNLSIGGLKNLTTGTWAIVEYDGAAWFLAAYGAL